MLCFNNYLKEIDLSANQLGIETIKFLQVALKGNNTIRKIDLCYNDIILNEDVARIAEVYPLLVELNFKHTNSDDELVKKLDGIMVKKPVKLHLNKSKAKFI